MIETRGLGLVGPADRDRFPGRTTSPGHGLINETTGQK